MPRLPSRPRFRRASNARQNKRPGGLAPWWLLWRVPALAGLVMAVWWFAVRPVASEQGWVQVSHSFALCGEGARAEGCVIDGDTLFISGSAGGASNQRRIRLTGFDAPELDGACKAETRLANAARERLHQWLSEGPFEWNGANSPPRDRYGRELRAARRQTEEGEETLAQVMIASGLAAPSGWGTEAVDWCAK